VARMYRYKGSAGFQTQNGDVDRVGICSESALPFLASLGHIFSPNLLRSGVREPGTRMQTSQSDLPDLWVVATVRMH
jgi:hypothetical protein